MEHDVGHRNEDHRLTAFRQGLVVFGQSAVLAEPGERPFHDPALGQNDELVRLVALDDFDRAAEPAPHPIHELTRIPAIGEDQPQPPEPSSQLLDQQPGPLAVLDIGRMHDQGHDQPQGVDDQVALSPQDLLARVVPTIPPFSAVLTDWLSRIPTLGVGFLPVFRRTWARRRS
jgi:hypothetical protein